MKDFYDLLDDTIGSCINDNAKECQKSERLYYDEDDFGVLTKKLNIAVGNVMLDWHGAQMKKLLEGMNYDQKG